MKKVALLSILACSALLATINPAGKQVTMCATEAQPYQSGSDPNDEDHSREARPRRRIDMAKPQPADCHLFASRVNNPYKYPPTRDWIAELRAGAFVPTGHLIQKRFGHAWIEGEAEFTYRFKRHWGVWGNAGYSFKNGHSPFHHTAHLSIIPVSAGLKYIFCSHKIRPYLGIGPCYTFVHFKNYSPLTRRKIYKNRWGFAAKSGIYFDLPRHWVLDLFVDYYYQEISFLRAKKANLGGFRAGIGLGYKF